MRSPDAPSDGDRVCGGLAHLKLGGVGARDEGEELEREGGGRVDPEPEAHVPLRDPPPVGDPLAVLEVGGVEVEEDVREEGERHKHLEDPDEPLGLGLEANAERDDDRRVQDQEERQHLPPLLPRAR
eukprot:634676-Prymnesium_polylepis.1